MLDRVLELNLRQVLGQESVIRGQGSVEEFSDLLREIYEEISAANKMSEPLSLRDMWFKIALTNLSEDLADFLYRSLR